MYFSLYYFSFSVFHQLEGEKKERRKILLVNSSSLHIHLIYYISCPSGLRWDSGGRGDDLDQITIRKKKRGSSANLSFLGNNNVAMKSEREEKRIFVEIFIFEKKKLYNCAEDCGISIRDDLLNLLALRLLSRIRCSNVSGVTNSIKWHFINLSRLFNDPMCVCH